MQFSIYRLEIKDILLENFDIDLLNNHRFTESSFLIVELAITLSKMELETYFFLMTI